LRHVLEWVWRSWVRWYDRGYERSTNSTKACGKRM